MQSGTVCPLPDEQLKGMSKNKSFLLTWNKKPHRLQSVRLIKIQANAIEDAISLLFNPINPDVSGVLNPNLCI